jgi:hypothetical protein
VEGEALLNRLPQLKGASVLIRHQYERYDGSGLPVGLAKQTIPLGARFLSAVSDYISYLDGSMSGETMSVSAAIGQLIERKGSYYDPDIVDALINVLQDSIAEESVAMERPEVKKSWKSGSLRNKQKAKKFAELRQIVEVPWPQLRVGMALDSVYFGDKPYIRNCVVDKKIIGDIFSLSERTGKDPIIKIRLDKETKKA